VVAPNQLRSPGMGQKLERQHLEVMWIDQNPRQ
jgi:hypothetical protein